MKTIPVKKEVFMIRYRNIDILHIENEKGKSLQSNKGKISKQKYSKMRRKKRKYRQPSKIRLPIRE